MIPFALNRRGGFLRVLDVDRRRTVFLRRTGLRREVLRLTTAFFLREGLRLTVARLRLTGFRLVVVLRRAVFFFRRPLLNATSFAVARRCAGVLAFFRAMRRPFLGLIRKII